MAVNQGNTVNASEYNTIATLVNKVFGDNYSAATVQDGAAIHVIADGTTGILDVNLVMDDTTGLVPGQQATGAGYRSAQSIVSVDSSTQITMSAVADAVVERSYVSGGSSGFSLPKLIVNDTTDLRQGMLITGTGYSSGQTILHIINGTTLTMSDLTDVAISATYVSGGLQTTTLIVDDTTGIIPGMGVTGDGYSGGQTVSAVIDGTTLTISALPDAVRLVSYVGGGFINTTLTVGETAGMTVGMMVSGPGYTSGQTIVGVINETTLIMSAVADVLPDGVLSFRAAPTGVLDFHSLISGTLSFGPSPENRLYFLPAVAFSRKDVHKFGWGATNIDAAVKPTITIIGAVGNGSTITYTTDVDHEFANNTHVDITGIVSDGSDPSSLNATKDIIIAIPTPTTFTVESIVTDTYISGGAVSAHIIITADRLVKLLDRTNVMIDHCDIEDTILIFAEPENRTTILTRTLVRAEDLNVIESKINNSIIANNTHASVDVENVTTLPEITEIIERTTPWEDKLECEWSWTFSDYNAARYFFNSGGQLRLSMDIAGGSTIGYYNWADAIFDLGTLNFNWDTVSQATNRDPGTSYGRGFYDLTENYGDGSDTNTSEGLLFVGAASNVGGYGYGYTGSSISNYSGGYSGGYSSGYSSSGYGYGYGGYSTYSTRRIKLYGKYSSSGEVIHFKIVLDDSVYDSPVDGIISTNFELYMPTIITSPNDSTVIFDVAPAPTFIVTNDFSDDI